MLSLLLSVLHVVPSRPPTLFDSPEEAATYALALASRISPYYEIGGVIVKVDGKYAIGRPRTDFSGDSVQIDHDPDNYKDEIVADYHTHPCLNGSHVPNDFSPSDLMEYRLFRVEGFMGDLCTGNVHAFKVGLDKRPARGPFEGDEGLTEGRIVGHFPVKGRSLE